MAEQAAVLAPAKKSEIVTFLTGLFAAPFATLTEDQRQRVTDWCPAELATPEAPELGAGIIQTADEVSEEDEAGADGDEEDAAGDLEAA